MHICIREDAYRADRCEVARIFRPRKSPKRRTFHAKLTNCGARNFRGSERERRGEGGEERREDGIKRNMEYEDGATPTSSPCLFRTPFRWSVYIGESVWSRILAGLNYLFVPRFSFSPSFFSSYPSYPCIINDLVGKKNWSKIFLNQRREKINK